MDLDNGTPTNIGQSSRKLKNQDYTVGWVCALHSELTAAITVLDKEHGPLGKHSRDDNNYVLGEVFQHNVVIACLPAGQTGTNSAATVAAQMRSSFQEIQFFLMVGIGGGVPSEDHDIRLGDVVISQPGRHGGGVVQYDFGRTIAEGQFVQDGFLNAPPPVLLTAISTLQAKHKISGHRLATHLERFDVDRLRSQYLYQGATNDTLFEAEYDHATDAATCEQCDMTKLVLRSSRQSTEPAIHYGTIASGNQVMRHGGTREKLRRRLDVLCFEMEAAGLMSNFPCLVIRGICDYADSHKTKLWQGYAAATAAAYAKELLGVVPVKERLGDLLGNGLAPSLLLAVYYLADFKPDAHSEFALGLHLERVHMIPYFTARPEYIEALEAVLLPRNSPTRKVFVLYGLGGIGKTQLAIKFAKDNHHEFDSTFFVDGSSQESLFKSFALIYRRTLEHENPESTTLIQDSQISPSETIRKVLQWFSRRENNRWLLIFDNIDRGAGDDGGFDVVSFFPPKDQGSILITTRLAPLARVGRSKKVVRMSEAEALDLLDDCLGKSTSQDASVLTSDTNEASTRTRLLQTLDGLPLAISQAGRFIQALNLNLETYLDLYGYSKREVMDMLSCDEESQHAEKGSIRTTWTTSLNLLKEKAAKQGMGGTYYAAHRLLQLFAYFEPTDLDFYIIRSGLICNNVPGWFHRTFVSRIGFFGVVKVLLDLCLIDNNTVEGSYSMHRVVHDWLCAYVSAEPDNELVRLATAAISFSAPLVLTHRWADEQQRLSLHAVHIYPSLHILFPHDLLVQYDKMSTPQLEMVADLLEEPVKCWVLTKFDLILMGIVRLLRSCNRSQDALLIIREMLSKCKPDVQHGSVDPLYTFLRYAEISIKTELDSYIESRDLTDLEELSHAFSRLGSPSWTVKSRNLRALLLSSVGETELAMQIWQDILAQSWHDTGSVFNHPTLMIFHNLYGGIKRSSGRRIAFLEQFEQQARVETRKIGDARWLLHELERLREQLSFVIYR